MQKSHKLPFSREEIKTDSAESTQPGAFKQGLHQELVCSKIPHKD